MSNQTFLVLANITLTDDGGHLYIRHIQTWTTAPSKQAAASMTALWLREYFKQGLVKDEINKVLAKEDWGTKYFPTIKEDSLNG